MWGAATAACQIEGAWNEDGRGPSIWDVFCHEGSHIAGGDTADVACDHYHRYKEDVALMASLGLHAYRFSVSWSRIFPKGTKDINPAGVQFYNNLIDELLSKGITPFITLYHWDLPYALYQKGGWLNRESASWFASYAHTIGELFGDRVKHFITFNEPSIFTGCGYKEGNHAPGYKLDTGDLLTVQHNIQLAHGMAVTELRKTVPDSKIGITIASGPAIPVSESDEEAAYKSYFDINKDNFIWSESAWVDPIVLGTYPDELKAIGEKLSAAENLFTAEDLQIISKPIDFIGLNIYMGRYVGDCKRKPGEAHTDMGWSINDGALQWGTTFIYRRYKLPIYITENGMANIDWVSLDGKVHDPNRIDYLNRYLSGLKKSAENGTDIRGYFQWSFIDNFEWAEGYRPRFGMIFCDYETQRRIPKDSAFWYANVIKTNGENL